MLDHEVLVVTDSKHFRAFYKDRRLRKAVLRFNCQGEMSNGNPYNIYGGALEEWLGVSKFDMTITVAHVSSGDL